MLGEGGLAVVVLGVVIGGEAVGGGGGEEDAVAEGVGGGGWVGSSVVGLGVGVEDGGRGDGEVEGLGHVGLFGKNRVDFGCDRVLLGKVESVAWRLVEAVDAERRLQNKLNQFVPQPTRKAVRGPNREDQTQRLLSRPRN